MVEKVHVCCLGMPSHEHKMSRTSTDSAKDAGPSLYLHFEIRKSSVPSAVFTS